MYSEPDDQLGKKKVASVENGRQDHEQNAGEAAGLLADHFSSDAVPITREKPSLSFGSQEKRRGL